MNNRAMNNRGMSNRTMNDQTMNARIMNRRRRQRAIRLNRLLWRFFMLLVVALAALLYARFHSLIRDTGNITEAVQTESVDGTEAVELFGKSLSSASFQKLVQDENVIFTTMSSYYDEKSDVEKEYSNLHTWSQEGLTDGSYFVYAAYEVVLAGIDTPVPSLSWAYLQTGEDGSLYFSDVSEDELVQELVESVRSSEEGQALIAFAQQAYEEAVASDDALAQYMEAYQTTNTEII